MALFTIDREKCNRDGLCAAVCPVGIIGLDPDKYPVPVEGADDRCINCGQCVAICPSGCFDHRAVAASECSLLHDGLKLTREQCGQLFKGRRSVRNYKKRLVEQDIVEELLDLVRYAPSGHNSGGVRWLVLADKKELQAMKQAVADWMLFMLNNKPEFALMLHLDATFKRWTEGEDVILRNAPMLIVGIC